MRRLRYSVAMSLDGFIAGPKGEYDWIVHDPIFDFAALFSQFDTLLMGRLTYAVAQSQKSWFASLKQKIVVVSTLLDPTEHNHTIILRSGVAEAVAALKAEPGKDIWLMGGGMLFRSLLDAGLVDSVEVSVLPVLLGSGVPLLPEGRRCSLRLEDCETLPNTGTVLLKYAIPA